MLFEKRENVKHALENRKESAHHGVSVVAWPSVIQHSKSANQHSKSAERHFSCAKWHTTPPSNTHACNSAFLDFFFRFFNTQKVFFFLGQIEAF